MCAGFVRDEGGCGPFPICERPRAEARRVQGERAALGGSFRGTGIPWGMTPVG